jgi:bifunctional non-homologous end joining protein LigD
MECTQATHIPQGAPWQYQPKLDGYRAIAVIRGSAVSLFSRRGHLLNRRFPGLVKALERLPLKSAILDGEVVAFDKEGRISFALVEEPRRGIPLHFFVFDLLALSGKPLLSQPLSERQLILRSAIRTWPEFVRPCPVLGTEISAAMAQVRQFGFEGLVAKRLDSPYQPGLRPGTWVKHKIQPSADFVVGGWMGGPNHLAEALVGERRAGKLYFVDSVKAGFIARTRGRLLQNIRRLEIAKCPFVNLPERGVRQMNAEKMKLVRWVKPKTVVEIAFNNRTEHGHLRHARFLRLRAEKL